MLTKPKVCATIIKTKYNFQRTNYLMTAIKWLYKHFEEVCLAVLLFSMVVFSGLQVFMRYITFKDQFGHEIPGRYLLIPQMTMKGGRIAYRQITFMNW